MRKVLLFLCVVMMAGCGRTSGWQRVQEAETMMQDHPDSSLLLLREVDPSSIHGGARKAKYSLLMSMALDKNYIDATDSRIISPAVEYYDRYGTPDQKLKSLYYLGRVQENNGDYSDAIVSLTKAMDYIGKNEDNKYDGMLYSAIAAVENKTMDLESALDHSIKAYNIYVENGNTEFLDVSRYLIEMNYSNVHQIRQADSLFNVLIDKGNLVEEPIYSQLRESYAYMLMNEVFPHDSEKAAGLFSEVIENIGLLERSKYWAAYALALAETGKEKTAWNILDQLKETDSFVYNYWSAQTAAHSGNYSDAYERLFRAFNNDNSVEIQTDALSVPKAQRDYFEQQNEINEANARMFRMMLIIIVLSVMLVGVSLYGFISRHKRKAEEEKAQLALLAEMAREELHKTEMLFLL